MIPRDSETRTTIWLPYRQMKDGKKLAILTHHPGLTLSYARVAREVGYGLERLGFRVTWLGLPLPRTSPASHRQAVMLPQTQTLHALANWLEAHRPEVLLTIGDPWMFPGIPSLTRKTATKWLAYFPVDGLPLPEGWETWIHDCHAPVVFSRFAHDVVFDATGVRPPVAPHGVDAGQFHPTDRVEAKSQVGVEGFVVGTVAANQQRKNLPALLEAFARFAKDKSDVQLYLHTPVTGPCWDLLQLARHLDIEPRTRATLNYDPARGLPDEQMRTIYNSFDVFVLPTMAEGFGLPLIEAQACGVPTLATDFSACSELLPDAFQRLRIRARLTMQRNIEQAVVDVDDIVEKLQTLYDDPELRSRLSIAGIANAMTHTWDRCAAILADEAGRLAS